MAVVASGFFDQVGKDPAQTPRPPVAIATDGQRSEVGGGNGATTSHAGVLVERAQSIGIVVLGGVEVPVPVLLPWRAGPRL